MRSCIKRLVHAIWARYSPTVVGAGSGRMSLGLNAAQCSSAGAVLISARPLPAAQVRRLSDGLVVAPGAVAPTWGVVVWLPRRFQELRPVVTLVRTTSLLAGAVLSVVSVLVGGVLLGTLPAAAARTSPNSESLGRRRAAGSARASGVADGGR